ncbi:hypothetical protein HK100_009134, partial [Physocladia obscura]
MAEKTLGIKMRKDECIHTGNWMKLQHSKEEIQYALEDAWFGLMIYQKAKHRKPNSDFGFVAGPITDESPIILNPVALVYLVLKRVLLDGFHALQRIGKVVSNPNKHPATSVLMKAIRDAIYIVNDTDKINIGNVIHDKFDGMTFDE